MSISMHQAYVTPILQTLTGTAGVIDKAIAHCANTKIEDSVLMNYRLAANMFPLARQFQIATDHATGLVARLAGMEVPTNPGPDTTLEGAKDRVNKTIAFIKGVDAGKLDGSESREVTLKLGGNDTKMPGLKYATALALPNFYFHAATAYDILRHAGVELGKRDFLGPL